MAVYFKGQATFTPAATAHAAGDVIGTKQSFGQPEAGHWIINRASVRINDAAAYASALTIHLFTAVPTTIADDAPFTVAVADRAIYLGSVAIGTAADLVDTQFVGKDNVGMQVDLNGGELWGFLVTDAAATPAAVGFVVTVNASRD